ncbi:anti-sigma factor [Devosia ginsengisoli]|uniref:anti-sigma factor n=1 Tax=Devosia ginsengisoli TaxID=400770 RepID=UPI0026ECA345|nr:anti-sigma factor [Devosia ginsengisoli]MCR6670459.1 anti-sigma factor [Devosia ginsengisoli]
MSASDDIGGDHEGRNALVAEYVLGLLSTSEHERVGRLIEADAGLRAERDFWVARFAALDDEYAEVPPPAHLYAAIEARAFGEGQKRVSLWENLLIWRGIAAGALAVAIAAIGFNLLQPAPDVGTLTTQLVAALEEEGSDVKFVALYDGSGSVRLTALSGEDVPDRDFELWAIQGDNAPVSMGVIPVGERSTVTIAPEILAGWGEGSVLAITLEPEGGSPSGAPTGPIVAKGAVTRI